MRFFLASLEIARPCFNQFSSAVTMEATGGEMFAQQHILEGGEMMLAKMVEERDKNKLDLFLQEMDNVDKFLDGAEALRSGHDQSSSGMDDLLQLSYGDLVPMKDIPT